VNHFFRIGVKKVALCQLDTHFTFVEVVPEEEFARIVGRSYERTELSDSAIEADVDDPLTDSRRNLCYTVLNTSLTLSRHTQLEPLSAVFRRNELVSSVLINGYYLRRLVPDESDFNKLANTILIDSPGFTAQAEVKQFLGNLEVLQFLYKISDLTVFFIPSESINLVASQIHMLELSILYAFQGPLRFKTLVKSTLKDREESFRFRVSDLFQLLARQWLTSKKEPELGEYEGTHYFDRIRFVITKIDRVYEKKGGAGISAAEAQFYELGTVLGRNLKFLKPPTFQHCFAISIPSQLGPSFKEEAPPTRDLPRLLSLIYSVNYYSNHLRRLEGAIQVMCGELRGEIEASWYHTARVLTSADVAIVDRCYERSRDRCNSRQLAH